MLTSIRHDCSGGPGTVHPLERPQRNCPPGADAPQLLAVFSIGACAPSTAERFLLSAVTGSPGHRLVRATAEPI